MKFLLSFFFLSFFILFLTPTNNVYSQTFDGEWKCLYRTLDDQPNSTGWNTPAVGAIKENTFVALVSDRLGTDPTKSDFCYLVGYTNADSLNGRMGFYEYQASIIMQWSSGFDAVDMNYAFDIATTPDSFIYVANNDLDRNILVFKMSADSIVSTEYRLVTGADSIWAIDVDASGRVYVTTIGVVPDKGEVLVFDGFQQNIDAWASTHTLAPLATLTVPDTGQTRGVAVNAEGTVIYVSNYNANKIYCYTGSPSAGYALNTGFNFTLEDTVRASTGALLDPGPWGLGFMDEKNVLFAAFDVNFLLGIGYQYGRIYALNPNTGTILDTVDVAGWNFAQTGSYTNYTPGNVPGYASVYNIDFDENFNVYDQSMYGWSVDKWQFTGTIPTIPLTITGIVRDENTIPVEFSLAQNYPNPFNPSTTIEFSLPQDTDISLSVYSVTGELVTTLIENSSFAKGNYKLTFDASKLASGNYIYVLTNNSLKLSRKMSLIK